MKNVFAGELGTVDRYASINDLAPWIPQLRKEVAYLVADYVKTLKDQAVVEVLEPGCGSGKETVMLLATDPRIRVTGIDSSRSMLDQIEGASERLSLIEGDAVDELRKLADSTYDVFVGCWFTHNMTPGRRAEFCVELARVLKPGALYVNCDIIARDDEARHLEDIQGQLENVANIATYDYEAAQAWKDHMLEDARPEVAFTESEQNDRLAENGFGQIQMVTRVRLEAIVVAIKK